MSASQGFPSTWRAAAIGDSPIGVEPDPPHVDPPWEQPFTLERPYACPMACPVRFYAPMPVYYVPVSQ